MKKLIMLISLTVLVVSNSVAQNVSAGASQSVNLSLTNVIDISFVATGNNIGNMVVMPFTSVNDFANGVTSSDQQLIVRSNKRFNVRVKAKASKFTYSGTTSPSPSMTVSSVLAVKVTNNGTGGQIGTGYTVFKSVSTTAKEIIKNATPGGNNTLSVQYKATPGFSYPAGNYNVDIIYTATQS